MSSILKQYIRDEKKRPVGLFLALNDEGTVRIGVSKCNVKYNKFNKERANKIAYGRAIKGTNRKFPDEVNEEVPYFLDRCERYFKQESDKFISAV